MTLLKWPGSKAEDAPYIANILTPPEKGARYFEPFLGAGHVAQRLFAMHHENEIRSFHLSDATFPLIAAWEAARRFPRNTVEVLIAAYGAGTFAKSNGGRDLAAAKQIFDSAITQRWLRPRESKAASWAPPNVVLPAAWLLYVINTCFNGLYRVDQAGAFNAPFGKRAPDLDEIAIRLHTFSNKLVGLPIELSCIDFELAVADAGSGDLVYFDPPYTPKSRTASFTGYTGDGFGDLDRGRLGRVFNRLVTRGCRVALSDADVPEVRERYAEHHFISLSERRSIAAKSASRAATSTVLIVPKWMAP